MTSMPLPIGHERNVARERHLARQRQSNVQDRNHGFRTWEAPAIQPYAPHRHNQQIVPNVNRFSVLAEMDHSSPGQWAFDFCVAPKSPMRKRKRSAMKQAKLQTQGQPHPDERPAVHNSPSLDGTQQPWTPWSASRPQQSDVSTFSTKPLRGGDFSFPRAPSPVLTRLHHERQLVSNFPAHRKESRFFPLSAFVAPSDSNPAQQGAHDGGITKQTDAEKAAVSAAIRVLNPPKTISPPLAVTMTMGGPIRSPPATTSPNSATSPLPITPSLTVFPALTLLPKVQTSFTNPWLAPTSPTFGITSLPTSPSSSEDFHILTPASSESPSSALQAWTPVKYPSPRSLASTETSPIHAPYTPNSVSSRQILPATPIYPRGKAPVAPNTPLKSPAQLSLITEMAGQREQKRKDALDVFLSMGHARECWCDSHRACSVAPADSPAQNTPSAPAPIPTDTPTNIALSNSLETVLSAFSDHFERIPGEDDVEEGWTVVVPEARFSKSPAREKSVKKSSNPSITDGLAVLSDSGEREKGEDEIEKVDVPGRNVDAVSAGLKRSNDVTEWPSLKEAMSKHEKKTTSPPHRAKKRKIK